MWRVIFPPQILKVQGRPFKFFSLLTYSSLKLILKNTPSYKYYLTVLKLILKT